MNRVPSGVFDERFPSLVQVRPSERLPGASVDHRADFVKATPVERMLGGPPLVVFIRLVFVSLLVGAFLMWFDIRPFEIFNAVRRLIDRLWFLGWDSVRTVADYVLAGAILVVPCWLVLRLMNFAARADQRRPRLSLPTRPIPS